MWCDRVAVRRTLFFQEASMRKCIMIAALACSVVGSPSVLMAQESKAAPDGSIEFTGGAAALGMGYTWGNGILHYKGKDYPFTASGLTLLDVGGTKNEVSGDVYRLNKVEDFAGKYSSSQAGATLVGGGGIGYLENEKGVIVKVTSSTKGARLNLGMGGVEVSLKQ
jgi:hypothetical protein